MDTILTQAVAQLRSMNKLPPRHALRSERDALGIRIEALRTELETSQFNSANMVELIAEIKTALAKRRSVERELIASLNSAITAKSDIERKMNDLGAQ